MRSPSRRRRACPGSAAPPGSTAGPGRSAAGCVPATSRSSTTSTSTGHRPGARRRQVVAVVNAVAFISGRYPNLGPDLLAEAGVLLVDDVGPEVFARAHDGDHRPAGRRLGATSATERGVRAGAETPTRSPRRWPTPATGLATQLRELHPQHHRVPAPGAGPAAARPRRARAPGPGSPAGRSSWWSAATTTARTCAGCAGSSASSTRCWSGSTPAPTRCAAPVTAPTSWSSARRGSQDGAGEQEAVSDACARPARSCCTPTAPAGRSVGAAQAAGGALPDAHGRGASEDVALLLADVHGAAWSSPSAPTPPSTSSSTGSAPGSPAPSSPGCGSAPSSSTPRASPSCTPAGCALWHLALVLLAGLLALVAAVAVTPVGADWLVGVHRRAVRRTRPGSRTVHVISFRYHIVSIVSVFLSLAVGIALGGGPLKGEVDNTLVDQVKADRQTKSQLRADITGLRSANTSTTSSPTPPPRARRRPAQRTCRRPGGAADRPAVRREGPAEPGRHRRRHRRRHAAGGQPAGRRLEQAACRRARQPARGPRGRAEHPGRRPTPTNASVGCCPRRGHRQAEAAPPVDGAATSVLAGLDTDPAWSSTEGKLARRGDLVLFVTGAGQGVHRPVSRARPRSSPPWSAPSTPTPAAWCSPAPPASARRQGSGQGGPRRRRHRAGGLHRRRRWAAPPARWWA